jgi:hypothetical protein
MNLLVPVASAETETSGEKIMAAIAQETLNLSHDADALIEAARRDTGLSDLGGVSCRDTLARLFNCVATDVPLSDNGVTEFRRALLRILSNRLRFTRDLAQHPEILDENVSDPIIILGLPRSGTTKAQRMMGADPDLLKLHMWQALNPAPFPGWNGNGQDPRVAAANLGDTLAQNQPDVLAGHFFAIGEIDGDAEMSTYTLNDWMNINRAPSRLWSSWVNSRTTPSDIDNFRYIRRLYQYIQWQQGGRRDQVWLIKNVSWMGFLPEILEVFPNAMLVHIHRDPLVSLPSVAKLMKGMWASRLTTVDPGFVGDFLVAMARERTGRYLAARGSLALDARIIDVDYEQIRSDPMPVFEKIYARAGRAFSPQAKAAMLAWEADNEQGKHGAHSYSLAEFGMNTAMIEDALGPYIARFIQR